MNFINKLFCGTFFLLLTCPSFAQEKRTVFDLEPFEDSIHHWNMEHKTRNYNRYAPDQYAEIADNLMAYQNRDGGWAKNIDWLAILDPDSVMASLPEHYRQSTLDNTNIYPQIEYLADTYLLTGDEKYKPAILKGLDYLLATQKSNGGWRGWDVDAITFNDDVTNGTLQLFQYILQGDESFGWLESSMIERIRSAYERGIDVILRCQMVQNGVKTAWGQQHDNTTLVPVKARSYELPAITAHESCGVISLLMNMEHPTPEVIDAVDHAIAWLERSKIYGIRVEKIAIPENEYTNHEYPYDRVVVEDPDAEPIWARFYEIEDNTPFMCNRDGIKVWKLSDVLPERRMGYGWYGYWPKEVMQRYPEWRKRVTQNR